MESANRKDGKIYHKVRRKITNGPAGRSVAYTSKIRAIGNSSGIILNTKIMDAVGLKSDSEIIMHAENGIITIKKADDAEVNTDISSWDRHFKAAIKKGALPENDLFEGIVNDFDKNEW